MSVLVAANRLKRLRASIIRTFDENLSGTNNLPYEVHQPIQNHGLARKSNGLKKLGANAIPESLIESMICVIWKEKKSPGWGFKNQQAA